MTTKRNARTSADLDRLRARALQGDRLADLADADREWIWRSLLKGVRRREAVQLAGLTSEQVPHALQRVKRWYDQRIAAYKRQQAKDAMQPKVVRKVTPTTPPSARRGLFSFFGKER